MRGRAFHAGNELLAGHAEQLHRDAAHVPFLVVAARSGPVRVADVRAVRRAGLAEDADAQLVGHVLGHAQLGREAGVRLGVERAVGGLPAARLTCRPWSTEASASSFSASPSGIFSFQSVDAMGRRA